MRMCSDLDDLSLIFRGWQLTLRGIWIFEFTGMESGHKRSYSSHSLYFAEPEAETEILRRTEGYILSPDTVGISILPALV